MLNPLHTWDMVVNRHKSNQRYFPDGNSTASVVHMTGLHAKNNNLRWRSFTYGNATLVSHADRNRTAINIV